MLLCFPLIIASLPCTAATALFLEVYWDSGAQGSGESKGVGQVGAKEKGRRRPSHYAHSARTLYRMRHIC